MAPKRQSTRSSQVATPVARKRTRTDALAGDVNHITDNSDATQSSTEELSTSSSSLAFSLATSVYSASSPAASPSTSPRQSQCNILPPELLVHIVDFVPSFHMLLPLSSTCRHFYELVHEESVSGVLRSANAVNELSSRLRCWRHHPLVHVELSPSLLKVADCSFNLQQRDSSFVSYVLTSLRNLPHLQLVYICGGSSHATYLYPLRHFTHLRSLVLALGGERAATASNLSSTLATALLALPNLADLTVQSGFFVNSLVLDTAMLQRLTRERLLHLTLNGRQYDQLMMSAELLGTRRRKGNEPITYPNVQSVAVNTVTDSDTTTLRNIRRTFPNLKHIALSNNVGLDATELIRCGELEAVLGGLDSLYAHAHKLVCPQPALEPAMGCGLRCLYLWAESWYQTRSQITAILTLTPLLEQLAIAGDSAASILDDDPKALLSVFDDRHPLPKLTYLQFTAGLLISDLDFLLSSASPPAFAATLTHLELHERCNAGRRAADLLASVPTLYPSLQRCRISMKQTAHERRLVPLHGWRVESDGAVLMTGATVSSGAVREDRSDVAWRRAADLAPVTDECLGSMLTCRSRNDQTEEEED